MYYIKDHRRRKIDITTLKIYNRCPMCGKETQVSDFWDLFAGKEYTIFDTGVNCDKCTQSLIKSGKGVCGDDIAYTLPW